MQYERGKGDCWDNAVAESFFSSLKREVENIENMESGAAATKLSTKPDQIHFADCVPGWRLIIRFR